MFRIGKSIEIEGRFVFTSSGVEEGFGTNEVNQELDRYD